jgi:hypothetical protein
VGRELIVLRSEIVRSVRPSLQNADLSLKHKFLKDTLEKKDEGGREAGAG